MSEDWAALLKNDLRQLSQVVSLHPAHTEKLIPGERREVAVLFLDMKGFTAMSETMDHEMLHKIVGGVMQALARVVEGHGGYVDKFEGDQIMALFGAKRAGENDSIRAIACGLKMHETIKQVNSILKSKNIDLSTRVGISFGSVTVGPDPSGHLTAMGDVVNLASRMESTAKLNTIQVTEWVRQRCGDYYIWKDLGDVVVKGKKRPIHTFCPIGFGKTQQKRWERAARVARLPMIGRGRELAFLQNWWEHQTREEDIELNRRGSARHIVVGIKGDAGIGKSRLVHEFLKERNVEFVLMKGQTISYAQPPFWLWINILRNYFGIEHGDKKAREKFEYSMRNLINSLKNKPISDSLSHSSPFLSALLSIPVEDPRMRELDEKSKHRETLLALRNFVQAVSTLSQQSLLVLDDLHWLDSASMEALEFLIANCDTERPLFIICLYRPEQENKASQTPKVHENYASFEEITLSPIGKEACHELMVYMLAIDEEDKPLSEEIEHFLMKRSQGNPFFLEELLLDLIETGMLVSTERGWELSKNIKDIYVPSSLFNIIRARIDRLSFENKQGLQRASILGMEFLMRLYRRLTEKLLLEDQSERVLSELTQHDFLISIETTSELKYIFKHILTYNAAYDTILHHNRAILHRYTAEAFEELFPEEADMFSGIIAVHWKSSGDMRKALEWGMSALNVCKKNYQNKEGLDWAVRLKEWIEAEPEGSEKDEKLLDVLWIEGDIQYLLGCTDDQRENLDQCLVLCDSLSFRDKRGRILRKYGQLHRLQERMDEALDCFEQSLEIAREVGDRADEGIAMGNIGFLYWRQNRIEDALGFYHYALKIHREVNDLRSEGILLGNLGNLHWSQKNLDEALICYRETLDIHREIVDRQGEGKVLENIGNLYWAQGNMDEALHYYTQALDIYREIGDRMGEGNVLNNLSGLYMSKDNPEEQIIDALMFCQQALEIHQEIGNRRSEGFMLANLGYLYSVKNCTKESMDCYQQAINIYQEVAEPQGEVRTLGNLGVLYVKQDCNNEALESFLRALQISRQIKYPAGERFILCNLGILYYTQGNTEKAVDCYQKALSIIKELALKEVRVGDFIRMRQGLVDLGISESDLPLPEHWE